jgi:hypothetical protein
VPTGPAAEYSGGAYTIYATVALPGNSTVHCGGEIATRSMAAPNLRKISRQVGYTHDRESTDFFSHAWDGIESCWRCILSILQKKFI